MTANFYFFRPGVYLGQEPETDSGILGSEGNSLTPNLEDHGFGFQYFTDALMQNPHGVADQLIGLNLDSPQLFWAFVFNLDIKLSSEGLGSREFPMDNEGTQNPWAELDTANDTQGGPMGSLSCATNLSEVVSLQTDRAKPEYGILLIATQTYSYTNDSMNVVSTRTPSKNVSIPFVNGISSSWGHALLRQGLEQSFVGAETSQDFAAAFARVYDRVAMTVPAGIMVPLPAHDVSRRIQTTVARVPKAPFVTLIILNMSYVAVGVALTVTALLAVFLGKGVRDAQARLSVAAVVAESFESPALGDDATQIDHLYAERRGLPTRKIALASTAGGGRKYLQVVVKGGENAQRLLN